MMAGNSEPRMKQEPGVKTESDNLNCDSASSVQLNSDLHQNGRACPDSAMSDEFVMAVSIVSDNEVKTDIESKPNHSTKRTFSQSESELALQCGRNSDLNSAIGVCRNSNNVSENIIKDEIKTEPSSPGSSVPDPGHALTECDNVNRSEFDAARHSSRESEVISVALEKDIHVKQEFSDETNSPTNILNQQTQRPWCDDEFEDPDLKHEKSVSNSVEGNPSGALLKIEVEDPLQRSGYQLVDTSNQEQVSCPDDVYDETLGFKQQAPIQVMNVSPLFQQQENPGSVGRPHEFPHPPIIAGTVSSATARGTANYISIPILRLVRVKRDENNQGSHPSHVTSLLGTSESDTAGHQDTGNQENVTENFMNHIKPSKSSYSFSSSSDLELQYTQSNHGDRHDKPYRCEIPVCNGTSFATHTEYLQHKRSHIGPSYRTYCCQYCQILFKTQWGFVHHECSYKFETPFSCEHCGKKFEAQAFLLGHQHYSHNVKGKCKFCGDEFDGKILDDHERTHTEQNPYQCSYCPHRFNDSARRARHEEKYHASYKCEFCNLSFRKKSTCNHHERRYHSKTMNLKCKYCSYRASGSESLIAHESNCIYPQKLCINRQFGEAFATKYKKLEHERKVHTSNTQSANRYECQHCPVAVTEEGASLEEQNQDENYLFHIVTSSNFCGKEVDGKSEQHEHTNTRKGWKLRCKYCNYTASDSESHVAHESTCTFSQKQYKCSRSDERFATIGERLEHQHEVHAIENPLPRGIKSYECQHCKKGFSMQSLCLNHEKLCANHVTEVVGASRQKHTQVDNSLCHIETSECNFCGEKFDSKILEEHEHTHTEHNPYKCSICDRRFCSWRRRYRHERRYHTIHSHKCRYCSHPFRSKTKCTRHEKRHIRDVTKLKCKYCKHTASDSESLVAHESTCTYSQKQYTCSHCGAAFAKEKSKLQHERWAHTQNDEKKYMYECQHCKKGFNLERHYLKHEKLCWNSVTKDEQASSPLHVQRPSQDEKEKNETHGIFKCRSCRKPFKEMTSLSEHIATCTKAINSKVIYCNYCNKVFKRKEAHRKHELLHVRHNGVELHKCKYCNKMFTSDSIRRHELEHKCKICGKSFRHKGYIYSKDHISTHTVEKPHTCKQCGKHLKSERGLQEHELVHSGIKPHQCRFCDQTFRLYTTRLYHEQVHTGERLHKCQLCEKSFKYKVSLLRHQFVHTGKKPHQCKHCGHAFADRSTLRQHELLHSGIKPHQCRFCDATFRLRVSLLHHQLVHTGIKPHQCRFCDATFRLRVSLLRHQLVHTGIKPHQCRFCDATFRLRVSLLRHELVHTGEKPHQCEQCGQAYADRSALCRHELLHSDIKPHREIVHSGLRKPHQCRFCDKTFRLWVSLHKHELVHTGERPHKCKLCDKSYTRKESLLHHTHTHTQTGEKSHQCKQCDKAYAHKRTLRQHELLHSVPGGKPLQCKYCDKTFASRTGFRKHEIFHTGAGTHNCEQCERTFINNSTLQRHMLVHTGEKPHLCIHCGMAFKYKDLLSRHELQHSSSPGSHVEEGPTKKPVDEILHSGEKIQEADCVTMNDDEV